GTGVAEDILNYARLAPVAGVGIALAAWVARADSRRSSPDQVVARAAGAAGGAGRDGHRSRDRGAPGHRPRRRRVRAPPGRALLGLEALRRARLRRPAPDP